MTDELIHGYEERQKNRRQMVTKAVIDGRTMAETLMATGIHDNILKSANVIPLTYEIRFDYLVKARQGNNQFFIYHATQRTSKRTTSPRNGN